MILCRGCQSQQVKELLDVGRHPVSNRFLKCASVEEIHYSLVMGQCRVCGIVQLTRLIPVDELVPPYDWVTYNEPEGHLDSLVERLTWLPEINKRAVIAGISYKEDTILQRFNRLGFDQTWRLDISSDLGITASEAGIETIQDRLNSALVPSIVKKYGLADMMIVRHVIEHAYNPIELINTLRRLIKPTGYLVFEVPDCTGLLEDLDYSTIWEEHLLYFTPETFRNFFSYYQFSFVDYICYPYSHENSLVAIVQLSLEDSPIYPTQDALKLETDRVNNFARNLGAQKKRVRSFLSEYRKNHGKIAAFGAGHLACMFLNLMGIGEYIEFVVDDSPEKLGLYMPGSKLPVVGSQAIVDENIKLCLTALSPESEQKVMQKNKKFVELGGTFSSIFPSSPIALPIL